MTKEAIRKELLLKRSTLSPIQTQVAEKAVFKKLTQHPKIQAATCIACYREIQNEVPLSSFVAWCEKSNKKVHVPIFNSENQTYSWEEGHRDVILVPCVGIDNAKTRLGFGRGYYDRLLLNETGYKIAICYAFQMVDFIPPDAWDIPMDEVLVV